MRTASDGETDPTFGCTVTACAQTAEPPKGNANASMPLVHQRHPCGVARATQCSRGGKRLSRFRPPARAIAFASRRMTIALRVAYMLGFLDETLKDLGLKSEPASQRKAPPPDEPARGQPRSGSPPRRTLPRHQQASSAHALASWAFGGARPSIGRFGRARRVQRRRRRNREPTAYRRGTLSVS